jgi:phosphoribosylformylglycinamidine cyclo-ligase
MKYKDSGVDIDAASRALARAQEAIRSTWGEDVASEVGAFGGLYRLPHGNGYLVSSIDGVGTKLKVALAAGNVGGVGADLVNHSVNDILVQGARPWFFLDYFAAGVLEQDGFVAVVEGMATACRENGCALIGGETAEMPGIYTGNDFDLAGCIVGHVTEEERLGPERVREGMEVWAWKSSGLHTNGYSLARKVIFERLGLEVDDSWPGLGGERVGEALLRVHRSYLETLRGVLDAGDVRALAHITGGGIPGNLSRVLPPDCDAVVDLDSWSRPPLFALLAEESGLSDTDLYETLNMGVGMIVVVPADRTDSVLEDPSIAAAGGFACGEIVAGNGTVRLHRSA